MSDTQKYDSSELLRQRAMERLGDPEREELQIQKLELELQSEELQRSQERLSVSNARYHGLYQNAPIAFLELNAVNEVVSQNQASLEQHGDISGCRLPFLGGAAAERISSFLRSETGANRTGAALEIEMTIGKKSFWARLKAASLEDEEHKIVSVEDVTESLKTHFALQDSENRLRTILDMAPDAIVVVSNRCIRFANPAFCRLLKLSRSEVLYSELDDHLDKPNSPLVPDEELHTLVLKDRSGRLYQTECKLLGLTFEGAEAVLLLMRDISERFRLRSKKDRVEKLASMGMLISGVAHEINNTLAYLLGNLELLRESHPPGSDDSELFDEACKGAERLAAITKDLSVFQKTGLQLNESNVNEIVSQASKVALAKLDRRVNLTLDLGLTKPVLCNEVRLGQVFLNLILNAGHALRGKEGPQRLSVRSWSKDEDVCVAVEDNGTGIAPEHLPYLFDPFYTTRRNEGGTGLGLATSNGLVQQMGGFISVESELGRGSTFIVHLPVCKPEKPGQERAGTKEAPLSTDPLSESPDDSTPVRILAVDDEASIRQLVSRAFRGSGVVVLAGSGHEAMKILEQDEEFDVVLSDSVMSNGSGEELYDWVLEHCPHLAEVFVFMTGAVHPSWSDRCEILLEKPFTIGKLREVVKTVRLRGG